MPATPGSQLFSNLMLTGDEGTKVDDRSGTPIAGEGWIVGLFAAGANANEIELRDGDTNGAVLFHGRVPAAGGFGSGWVPYDQWIPYTDGIHIETNTLSSGFTVAYVPAKVTRGP